MAPPGHERVPALEAVQHRVKEQACPYCDRRMYVVPFKEHPMLEVNLCYACGGCVVYELQSAPAAKSR